METKIKDAVDKEESILEDLIHDLISLFSYKSVFDEELKRILKEVRDEDTPVYSSWCKLSWFLNAVSNNLTEKEQRMVDRLWTTATGKAESIDKEIVRGE